MERSDPGVSTRGSMNISPIISKSQNVNVTKTAILLCLVHPYSLVKPNACFFWNPDRKGLGGCWLHLVLLQWYKTHFSNPSSIKGTILFQNMQWIEGWKQYLIFILVWCFRIYQWHWVLYPCTDIIHLYFRLCEASLHILCPFFLIKVAVFFLVTAMSSL